MHLYFPSSAFLISFIWSTPWSKMTILSLGLKELPSFSHVIVAGGTALWISQENLATDPSQVVVLWGSWLNLLDIPVEQEPRETSKPKLSPELALWVRILCLTKWIAWTINRQFQTNQSVLPGARLIYVTFSGEIFFLQKYPSFACAFQFSSKTFSCAVFGWFALVSDINKTDLSDLFR